jgi:starch phosphorylase
MPNVRTFVVVPSIPEKLKPMLELSHNLWTIWNFDAISLFRRLDAELWDKVNHNPVRMLSLVSQDRLQAAAADEGFVAQLNRLVGDLHQYMSCPTWYKQNHPNSKAVIAYFSAEYGLHESLPIYSGGLGVLSGDHMKSASELGLPLIGVGLFYRFGYFRQQLNADGWQTELYPENDFYTMSVTRVQNSKNEPLVVRVEFRDHPVLVNVWKIQVGRIPLYLMDADVPDNRPEDRELTARLYGGDQEMRIRQEILLGIGGIQVLTAMGIKPSVCHMNEGHSAFLSLERIRVIMQERGLGFEAAREVVAASNIFTTHTPVPAGNDAFHPDMIDRHLGHYYPKLGLSREQFMNFGKITPNDPAEHFGMTVLALRMAHHCNGVSALHGKVSREMWHRIWPDVPVHEIPIESITNGVHTQTWLSDEFSYLYSRYLGSDWTQRPTNYAVWNNIERIPDVELWRSHVRRRDHLVHFARKRLRKQLQDRNASLLDIQRVDEVLDPNALTIGFARRFATYKRATMLFRDPERLIRILSNRDRPVQLIFAGKSHPRDDGGKRFIQDIVRFCRREDVRTRIVFLEDYDMNVARYLVQGVDVWLNTPKRPMEASGTSGMKGPINGAINLSILDGWWEEAYKTDSGSGWAIGNAEMFDNEEHQAEHDTQALFNLLEKQVVPEFYERGADDVPRRWIERMKKSIQTVVSFFNTNRMVQEYFERFYLPANERFEKLTADQWQTAIDVTQWKSKVSSHWNEVRIFDVDANTNQPLKSGTPLQINAKVYLGTLTPQEVRVEISHGPLDANGAVIHKHRTPMTVNQSDNGVHQYSGTIVPSTCGQQGYGIRVLPKHPQIDLRLEPGLIRWF